MQSAEAARVVEFLHFCFPVGYEGTVPTPASRNHSSAINHTRDVDTYVATEVNERAMLGPFNAPLPIHTLVPGQHPPHPPQKEQPPQECHHGSFLASPISVNDFTPKEYYLSELKTMHLPSVSDLMDNIRGASHGCCFYYCDIPQAYRQLHHV